MGCGASTSTANSQNSPQNPPAASEAPKKPAAQEPTEAPSAPKEKPAAEASSSSNNKSAPAPEAAGPSEAQGNAAAGDEDADLDAVDMEEDDGLLAEEYHLAEVAQAMADRPVKPAEEDELVIGEEEVVEGQFKAVKPWVGAIAPPTGYEKPADQDEAPASNLELEHIYGVRSRDVHDTVYAVGKNVVYCTAAVNVVQDVATGKQRFFMEHTDDIVSLAVHRASGKAVSGQIGKDPSAWVWNVDTLQPICQLAGGHQRGVVCVDFSSDGSQVLSVGLDNDHTVVVWDANTGAKLATGKSGPERVLEAKFLPDGRFVTVGKRLFQLWTISGSRLSFRNGVFGNTAPRQTLTAVAFAGDSILTGALNGDIYVWNDNTLKSTVAGVHDGPIYSLRTVGDKILSGAKDGFFKVLDAKLKTQASFDLNTLLRSNADRNAVKSTDVSPDGSYVVSTVTSQIVKISPSGQMDVLAESHHGVYSSTDGYGELWGLSIVPGSPNSFVTACDDGTFRRWTIGERLPQVVNVGGNPRACDVSPDGSLVAVGFQDGAVRVYSLSSNEMAAEQRAHSRGVSVVRFSPDGKLLASGGHDSKIVFYNADSGFSVAGEMNKHSSYITQLDFSKDGTVLQSNCGAEEILFTKVETFEQDPSSLNYKDTEWETYSMVIGWPVQGIWPAYSDVTDVNAADRNFGGNEVVTGEDSGLVKLFRFPCLGESSRGKLTKRPQYKGYKGHSEHVTNVKFLPGDGYVISVGGADLSIFQWRHTQ